jgi:hypothetical protein
VSAFYEGQQFVGMDLHRRRSVLVRMSIAKCALLAQPCVSALHNTPRTRKSISSLAPSVNVDSGNI